jgi:hypothetical protein
MQAFGVDAIFTPENPVVSKVPSVPVPGHSVIGLALTE